MKRLRLPLAFLGTFWAIALWRYLATGKAFYLVNFGYIGAALAVGLCLAELLPRERLGTARRVAQALVGAYMLGYLGLACRENMQIEGFWLYLFYGVFGGATLHYLIAKIAGPLAFGRGWCGWACWTAMVLDLLPWKSPAAGAGARERSRAESRWGLLRYAHFALALAAVASAVFILGEGEAMQDPSSALLWLAAGNSAYYAIGISLAIVLKDNRAFCRYLCPAAVFLKMGAGFSLLKIRIDAARCRGCGLCERSCPMSVPIARYRSRKQRILSTECILCATCAGACPERALSFSLGFDGLPRKRGG